MIDLTRPTDPKTSGYARIMAVFGAIARHGPLGLDAVVAQTGLPRSACWRCLTTLEAEGWARRSLGEARFLPTTAARAALAGQPAAPDLLEDLLRALPPVLRGARVQVDVARFGATGVLRIVETTRPPSTAPEPDGFFDTDLSLALLMVSPTEDRLAHVRAAMASAPPDAADSVTSGRFTRQLAQAARNGPIWNPDTSSLTAPVLRGPTRLALRIEAQGSTKRTENRLRGLLASLSEALPGDLPNAAQVQAQFWPVRPPRRGE